MRVASDHPTKNGGWWHPFDDAPGENRRRRGVRTILLDSGRPRRGGIPQRASAYQAAVLPHLLDALADDLGVTTDSLKRLGVGLALDNGRDTGADAGDVARLNPSVCCWAFPMKRADGQVIGIRLRQTGRKWAVPGSRSALFIPVDLPARPDPLFVPEGPTDAAAMLSMGLNAIGRPSCTGAMEETARLVRHFKPKSIVIVSDADVPGRRGARALASSLAVYCRDVRIIEPPEGVKDVRAWWQSGATAADVLASVKTAKKTKIQFA